MKSKLRSLSALVLTALTLSLGSAPAAALTKEATHLRESQLNSFSPEAMSTMKFGSAFFYEKVHTLRAIYDFAVSGGAVSTITMKDKRGRTAQLPDGAIVKHCLIDVVTAASSAGSATIAIGTGQAGNDLKAATAIASYTGLVACVPVGSAATSIKMTADRQPSVTIATAALVAGKINVFIDYVLSE